MIGYKIDFLLILEGFWECLGGQVGPKIQQKSIKNGYGKVIEILIENGGRRKLPGHPSRGGGVP